MSGFLRASVLLLPLANLAHGGEYLTGVAGGGGGTAYVLRCPSDHVLVGITGRAGAWVDQIAPVCAQISRDGRWVGYSVAGPSAGAGGDANFSLQCPRDQALSGLRGRASSLVDQIGIRCGPLQFGPRLASSGAFLAATAGGGGGSPFGPLDCLDGKPGRGLAGRAGIYVDSLKLICDYPPAALHAVGAYLTVDGHLLSSIVRTTSSAMLRVSPSSPKHGNFLVPVRISDATLVKASDTILSFNGDDERAYAELSGGLPGRVGCTTISVGFEGDTVAPLDFLRDDPGGSALRLDLSILEWREGTPGAFGTLTTSAPAPSSGIAVNLSSNFPDRAIVPSAVTIPAGARATTFEIRRANWPGACVVITASGNGASARGVILFRDLPVQLAPRISVPGRLGP